MIEKATEYFQAANMSSRNEILNLFMKNQSKYKGFAYTLVLDWSIAEDAIQEAIIYLCDHWEKFEMGTNFDAWARAIVRNRCRELLRKEYVERKKAFRIADVISDEVWDEVEVVDSEQVKALHTCIESLPEKTKKIFILFYQQSKKCQLISEMLKMNEDAIYKVLSRVRQSLKTCITEKVKEVR